MKALLRYNTRHRLWFPRGYKGGWAPQLNPIESSSHGKDGKRTFSLVEPRWLFKARQRVFCHAGKQRCGRRGESHIGQAKATGGHMALPDTWDMGPDGNRTCSYCGSIHFEDLMVICRKAITDSRYGVEGTTKSYKVYVRQPGVRNASEGAIKFYKCHSPEKPRQADEQLFRNAMSATHARFEAQMAEMRAARTQPAGGMNHC